MAIEIPTAPDASIDAVQDSGIKNHSARPFSEALFKSTTMFHFVEERALEQLARTPTKQELLLSLQTTIDFIAETLTTQDETFHEQLASNDGQLSPEMHQYVTFIQNAEKGLNEKINTHRKAISETNPEVINLIQNRLIEQNEDMVLPMETRVKKLAAHFPGIQVITDNDGTLTLNPEEYLPYIPGSKVAEPRLAKHTRAAFPHIFVQNWQEVLRRAPHLFKLVGRELVKVRDGVFEFFEETKQNDVPLVVLTANFEPVANGVLQQNPKASDGVILWGVTHDDISAIEKDLALRRLSYDQPQRAIIYIGDGSSCEPTINASDIVLVYYALRGGSFEKHLQEKGIRYISYDTLFDVRDSMKRIGLLN